jgi:hypothetical protein
MSAKLRKAAESSKSRSIISSKIWNAQTKQCGPLVNFLLLKLEFLDEKVKLFKPIQLKNMIENLSLAENTWLSNSNITPPRFATEDKMVLIRTNKNLLLSRLRVLHSERLKAEAGVLKEQHDVKAE